MICKHFIFNLLRNVSRIIDKIRMRRKPLFGNINFFKIWLQGMFCLAQTSHVSHMFIHDKQHHKPRRFPAISIMLQSCFIVVSPAADGTQESRTDNERFKCVHYNNVSVWHCRRAWSNPNTYELFVSMIPVQTEEARRSRKIDAIDWGQERGTSLTVSIRRVQFLIFTFQPVLRIFGFFIILD